MCNPPVTFEVVGGIKKINHSSVWTSLIWPTASKFTGGGGGHTTSFYFAQVYIRPKLHQCTYIRSPFHTAHNAGLNCVTAYISSLNYVTLHKLDKYWT